MTIYISQGRYTPARPSRGCLRSRRGLSEAARRSHRGKKCSIDQLESDFGNLTIGWIHKPGMPWTSLL